ALRHGDANKSFPRKRVSVLLIHWCDVIETIEIWQRLEVGLVFDQLLSAAVKQPDMRIDAFDHFPVKLEHETQHTVRSGMLRTEIDGELAVVAYPLARIGCWGHLGLCHQASTPV